MHKTVSKLEKVVFPGRMAIEVMSSCSGGRCRALPLQHCQWWWPVVSSNSCTVVFPMVKTWVVQCQVAGLRKKLRTMKRQRSHPHPKTQRKPFKMYVWDVDVPFQKKVI